MWPTVYNSNRQQNESDENISTRAIELILPDSPYLPPFPPLQFHNSLGRKTQSVNELQSRQTTEFQFPQEVFFVTTSWPELGCIQPTKVSNAYKMSGA
jgi:hypothetical protein